MHLRFDFLKKERHRSVHRFEAANDLGATQQPAQPLEPMPQPAPEPAPESVPGPAPPAPQSDSNPKDRAVAIASRLKQHG
jgi:hypothetical protein